MSYGDYVEIIEDLPAALERFEPIAEVLNRT
jgi:hypothetical protein